MGFFKNLFSTKKEKELGEYEQYLKMREEKAYDEKTREIWANYVPKSGQAEFVVGELLRAIEKLRDEANRNGNVNFNEKCHGILVEYLREKLTDESVFDKETISEINNELDLLKIEDEPQTGDEIYDWISDRIIDWNLIYDEPIRHSKNSDLYC